MAMKTSKILFFILVMATLIYSPRSLFSSPPPSVPGVIFTYSLHPDFPLEKFARGELGVLQPTYARSYLCVAYRYLIGTGFDPVEQKALVALWSDRLGLGGDPGQEDWIKNWLDARNKVPGVIPTPAEWYNRQGVYRGWYGPSGVHRSDGGYAYYLHCPADAFRIAVRTLNERIEKFGVDSPEVRNWVEAQDQVFANGSGAQTIPAASQPGMPPLIQADRTYQIASAHFYAGNFDVAEQMFREIAKDAPSPWRQIAPYLVARTLVRKATLGTEGEAYMATLAQAEAELKKVLSDSSLSATHPVAKRLLGFVRFRLHPEERFHELVQAILKKNSGETLKQDLWDYTWLLDKFVGEAYELEQISQTFDKLSDVRRKDDVADWVLTFQTNGKGALEHSVQKWSETSSLPWLVASLSKIDAGHPKLSSLLKVAGKVKQDSPAFPTVAFHSIRLMIESGRKEEARKRLDSLLSKGSTTFPPSSRNLFLALRMKVARNLDEFLKYAHRVPAGITYDDCGGCEELPVNLENDEELKEFAGGRALFDADAARVLNESMPLSLLNEATKSSVLPVHLRRELALATWVRSVLLDNEKISMEIVPILENLVPELKPYLSAYRLAPSREARKFAAVFFLLKSPGTRPSIDAGMGPYADMGRLTPLDQIGGFNSPDFLDEAQKAAAKEEWERLSAIDLYHQVIEWAKRNPNDPNVPEVLHLVVNSTRGKFSKAAFQLLHKRYPKSSWTKKTKYWY